MRTLKQIESSRINGARSRGPVTPIGKATAAQNSTKHGLCSRDVVLTNEDPEAWESLRQSFLGHWQPVNDMETLMIDELAACQWKILRAESMETGLLNMEMDILEPEIRRTFNKIDEPSRQAVCLKSLVDNSSVLAQLDRHQTRLSRQFDRTWKRLDQLRKERPVGEGVPEITIVQNKPEPQPVLPAEAAPEAQEQVLQNEPKPPSTAGPQTAPEPTTVQNEPGETDSDPRLALIDRILSRFQSSKP